MKNKLSLIEKMIGISVLFNMLLLFVRIIYTQELTYGFYIWNTILALIPLTISRKIILKKKWKWFTIIPLFIWLLFLPNAPYLITDIFHFEKRNPIPLWFDLMIVMSAAWNGLIICIISILQIESFVIKTVQIKWIATLLSPTCILLCGYGVFIGRFNRFNSWDVITKPHNIAYNFLLQLRHPFQHIHVWGFTIVFASFLAIFYYTIVLLKRMQQNAPLGL